MPGEPGPMGLKKLTCRSHFDQLLSSFILDKLIGYFLIRQNFIHRFEKKIE